MKTTKQNLRKGEMTVKIENPDDLWLLSQVVDAGDMIRGRTARKIKYGEKEKAEKKPVYLKIRVKESDFSETALRISGTVEEGPEDVPKGSHHSFSLEPGSVITIIKNEWLGYQVERLKEAAASKGPKILITVFDRESAILAVMQKSGYKVLLELKGKVQKKYVKVQEENFYKKIIEAMKEQAEQKQASRIILASPSFWKEELMKELKDEKIRQMIVPATCSSVTKSAINEVLRRPELKEALRQERAAKEEMLVEELMVAISKNSGAAYGEKEVEEAANMGAVKTFLITDRFIAKEKAAGRFSTVNEAMKTVDKTKGSIFIITSKNDAGKRLDGLGGVGAILRFRIS